MDGAEHRSPSGLRLRRLLLKDTDEINAAYVRLGMEVQQLGRASGESWTASAELGQLSFRATALFGRHVARGSIPVGDVAMQFDMGSVGLRHMSGQTMDSDDITVVFGNSQFDLLLPEEYRTALFSLPHAAILNAVMYRAPGAERLLDTSSQLILSGA